MSGIIEVDNLGFAYDAGEAVLRELTFYVQPGSFTAVVGPNGAGKSTLINLLCAALEPQRGLIMVDGKSLESYRPATLARKMAIVRQQTASAFGFSVAETVMMARTSHLGTWGFESSADREAVARALEATDTSRFAERSLASLSGGERQRVFIARALAQETPLLLLDEPTSFLDLKHQVVICDLLKSAQIEQGRTILVVMHDINLAGQYCDQVLLLGRNCEYEYGKAGDVLTTDKITRFFDVETICGRAGSGRYFVPVGRFSKDADKKPQ